MLAGTREHAAEEDTCGTGLEIEVMKEIAAKKW